MSNYHSVTRLLVRLMMTGDGLNYAIPTPVVIMTVGDGMALLIIVQNDNDDNARLY